jgi:23S rRNA G2445 N2-methylase RlmL
MFASVVPGMAALVARQLDQLRGIRVIDTGFDGRSDLVLFDVDRGRRELLWSLRTIEDLFVEVGRTMRSSSDRPQRIAGRIWRPERVEKALSVWAAEVRPLAGTMTYRVIARVLQERSFLRTELRKALTQAISTDKPRWRFADPAQVEVWASEYQAGRIVAGLRLSDVSMRQHDGREVERSGALRPTVAAMMVSLAGRPDGTLLDPCCGSGTILSEAAALGWRHIRGGDIDPEAVEIARRNAPTAQVDQWDLRRLDRPDSSVSAIVANLPFGQQFEVQGSMSTWLAEALDEMARVTRPGGRLVLLTPNIPARVLPAGVRLRSNDVVRLLGTRTMLWVFDRTMDADSDRDRPAEQP